jgi:signal transduction histidine kinase
MPCSRPASPTKVALRFVPEVSGYESAPPGYRPQSALQIAAAVTGMFAAIATAWILITDLLLYALVDDRVLIARLETGKGWIFVGLACFLVYRLTLRCASRAIRAQVVVSAVVDSIGDGLLLLGHDRTIVHANPAALRMLRCDKLSDLLGMNAADFSRRFRVSYPHGALVRPDQFVSQRVFDEGGSLQYKALLYPPGGPELVISVTAAAVREEAGERPAMAVSVMHDVTVSENLARLRDQFFAGAAHALKTPVAVIKTNAQFLSREVPQELQRSTAAVERQCDRIDRMVQNLLVLGRAHSNSLQLHVHETDLEGLVTRVVRDMAPFSPGRDVRVVVDARPWVHGDEERLRIAVSNLLDVAIRTSEQGSSLRLLLQRTDATAEIGIRCQSLPEHERGCDAYGEYDDLGLSRCVADTIVEAHGGTLSQDNAGSATTTWMRLPISEELHDHT